MTRPALAAALAAALSLASCGGDEPRVRPGDPFSAVEPTAVLSPEDLRRAAPRWVRVVRLEGNGPATRELAIPGRSIQWRVRWQCGDGRELAMSVVPGGDLLRGGCPGKGEATAVRGGRLRLVVEASGPWSATVEQQVDAPLAEPPLPAMQRPGTRVLASGRFQAMERRGKGKVTLHRLPGGRLALRFTGFETSPSTDLEVWVSRNRRPRTSAAAVRGAHRSIAALKATAGSQNYLLPRDMRPQDVRSVVLWCEPLFVAYASAGLR